MSYFLGSIPIMFYPSTAESIPIPPIFILITDGSNLLMTDNDPLLIAGA